MVKREIKIFLIVGILTVVIDFVAYRGLIFLQVMNTDAAKASGFLLGTLFAYFANRFWTFAHKNQPKSSLWRFLALYMSTLVANIMVNSIVLKMLVDNIYAIQQAFLFATGFSATLNFMGMKFFVFNTTSSECQ